MIILIDLGNSLFEECHQMADKGALVNSFHIYGLLADIVISFQGGGVGKLKVLIDEAEITGTQVLTENITLFRGLPQSTNRVDADATRFPRIFLTLGLRGAPKTPVANRVEACIFSASMISKKFVSRFRTMDEGVLQSFMFLQLHKRRGSRRRYWVHRINQGRNKYGEYHHLMDEERCVGYIRTKPSTFQLLLDKIRPCITKRTTYFRKPGFPKEPFHGRVRF